MSVINAGGTPADLLVGGARVLIAPSSVAIPNHIDDIISLSYPYAAKSGWREIGYSAGASSVSRAFTTTDIEVEQETTPVFQTIQSVQYSASINFAELDADNISAFWPSSSTTDPELDVQAVHFGNFSTTSRYRLAIVALRPQPDVVTEPPGSPTGITRPRMVVWLGKSVAIAGDTLTVAIGKGALVAPDVAFTCFAVTGQPAGEEVGTWFLEHDGEVGSGS